MKLKKGKPSEWHLAFANGINSFILRLIFVLNTIYE
jgi:hypothetical protein